MLHELVAGYILLEEGSSVSQQFTDTFKAKEPFALQNRSALTYISYRIAEILESEDLNEPHELETYFEKLKEYLNTVKA
jgi:hypothetical protein